jgi:hypothetical protein
MILSKYIDWSELWDQEVCLDVELDDIESNKDVQIIKQFLDDDDICLNFDECLCQINDHDIVTYTFNFSETGGQNESDTQGWFRCYWFEFESENDGDLEFLSCDYEQG